MVSQTERAFKQPKKGLSYGELIIDNILGLDNEYESFGEKLGKAINKDEVEALKNAAVGVYEGTKEFVTSPVETTKKVVADIKSSVQRLGSENLDTRLKRMYGVSYEGATDNQVNRAKEAVFADALTALELIPAAKATQVLTKKTYQGLRNQFETEYDPTTIGNLNQLLEVDDGYNPVIYGDDGYDPSKNSITDSGVVDEIAEMKAKKTSGGFNTDEELIGAWQAGVLNAPEYFNEKYKIFKNKLKYLKPPGPESKAPEWSEYTQTKKFIDVYNKIAVDELLELAKDYPDPFEEPELFKNYKEKIAKFANEIKVNPEYLNDVVLDARFMVGDNSLTEIELPKAAESGDIHPKKATEYAKDPLAMPTLMSKKDRAAYQLGFKDIVYHLASSKDEFEKFKTVDELVPDVTKGPTDKFQGPSFDLLGIHVGTARAAAERSRIKSRDILTARVPRFTMQLRARLDKPARPEEIAAMVGLDFKDLRLDDSDVYFTEGDLTRVIKQKAKTMNPKESYISTTMENNAAIALRKELAKKGYTHIPYINELEDKESLSYIMLVDRPENSPSVLRDYGAEFNPEKVTDPDLRLAKGGTVDMNRQMEMAFMQEGGLKDDGTRQDPVSGNEVPSGSMASEVRDDIPAQLSEGEYVVPADVVRYLGVKHFEDLRNKAKSGLQKMEADGRIGGEPVPVGGPKANSSLQPPVPYAPPMAPQMAMGGDLTPEEMQEINSIMMASGGMVSGAATGSFYSPPSGMTVEEAITTPTRYTGGFSWEKPQAPLPLKTPVTETPATCAARGMVYNPETKMCEMPISTPAVADRGSKDGPDISTPDPDAWMEKYDYENVDNLLEQSSDALDPKTGIGGFFEKIFGGGVLGAFAKGANAAQIAANINILSSVPSSSLTPEQQTQLAGLKEKYRSYVKSNSLDIFGNELINGDQLAIDIITNPKNRGKGLFLTADSVDPFGKRIFKGGEKDPKFIKVMEEVASPGYKYDPNTGSYKPERDKDDDGGSFLAPDVSLRPKPRPKPSGGNNEEPKLEPKTPEPKAPDYTKPSQDPYAEPDRPKPGFSGADWSSGPLNKGGLMRKKKK